MPRGVYDRSKMKSKGQKQEKAAKPEKVAAKAAMKAEAPVEKVAKMGKKSLKAQKFEEKLGQELEKAAQSPALKELVGYAHFGSTQRDFAGAINTLGNLRTSLISNASPGNGETIDLVDAELKRLVPAFGQLVLPEQKEVVAKVEVQIKEVFAAPEAVETVEAPAVEVPQTSAAPIAPVAAPVFTPVAQATVPFNAPIPQ